MPAHETTFPTDKTRYDSRLACERERVNLGIVMFPLGAATCSPFNQTLSYQRYDISCEWLLFTALIAEDVKYISKLRLSTCKRRKNRLFDFEDRKRESVRGWKGVLIRGEHRADGISICLPFHILWRRYRDRCTGVS